MIGIVTVLLVAASQESDIDRLVHDLNSERSAERDKAEAALEKIGKPALGALWKVIDATSGPGTRRRARRTVDTIVDALIAEIVRKSKDGEKERIFFVAPLTEILHSPEPWIEYFPDCRILEERHRCGCRGGGSGRFIFALSSRTGETSVLKAEISGCGHVVGEALGVDDLRSLLRPVKNEEDARGAFQLLTGREVDTAATTTEGILIDGVKTVFRFDRAGRLTAIEQKE